MTDTALSHLLHGDKFPYDEDHEKRKMPPPNKDWAERAARGVLAELSGRKGIDDVLDDLDHELRSEIVQSLADIIRTAHECGGYR